MFSKHQSFKLISRLHSFRINTLGSLLSQNPLCTITEPPTITESPELPNWLKTLDIQTSSSAADSDDDFVIPSLATWVENQKFKTDQSKVSMHWLNEKPETDVGKISEILRKSYQSPDDVVQALDCCSVNVSNILISQVLKRFNNDWIPAFGVFTWAKSQTGYMHSPDLYNMMVDILGKSKKFKLMWELVEDMNQSSGYVSLDTIAKVMRRLARAGMYTDAIEAFKGLDRYGVSKDAMALSVLMDALAKENSVERASEVFDEFKDSIQCDSRSFNVLIHGFCKARKVEEGRKIMDEMDRYGLSPDVVSYTSFVEAYCHEKDFRKVDTILEEMEEKGCKPNIVTYTIIMHALGKAKQIKEALEVFEKMKRNGCLPDTSFYSSLVFILGKAGRLNDANEVFVDMEKQGVPRDVITYNTMISSACTHSQEEGALKLLKKMEEDSCKPDLKTYAPLLKMFCRKKRMKVLSFLLHHMFHNDVSLDLATYNSLVLGLCNSGKLEPACLFFEEIVLKGMVPRDSTYTKLVQRLEAKDMIERKARIEELMSQARCIEVSVQV